MNLTKSIHISLVIIFTVLLKTFDFYKWDPERQTAARFLTEKIFGAFMNHSVSKAFYLTNNTNFNKLKRIKSRKYNKGMYRNKWNGISKKILKNNDKYEKNMAKHIETQHLRMIPNNNINYSNEKKIKSFGNFKSHLLIDKQKILNQKRISSNEDLFSHANSFKQKLIKVEASPFIRELPFEDHDLHFVASNIAGIKTLIVDEPLQLKKSYY